MKEAIYLFPVSIEGGEYNIGGRACFGLRLTDRDGGITNVVLDAASYQQLGQLVRTMLDEDFRQNPH